MKKQIIFLLLISLFIYPKISLANIDFDNFDLSFDGIDVEDLDTEFYLNLYNASVNNFDGYLLVDGENVKIRDFAGLEMSESEGEVFDDLLIKLSNRFQQPINNTDFMNLQNRFSLFGGTDASSNLLNTQQNSTKITIETPSEEILKKGVSTKISWRGGNEKVQIGIKTEKGDIAWLHPNQGPEGSLNWNTSSVCNIDITECFDVEQFVGRNERFKIFAVSKDQTGKFTASVQGNYAESNFYKIFSEGLIDQNNQAEAQQDADLTPAQLLDLMGAMFGSNSEIYQVVELLISLGIVN